MIGDQGQIERVAAQFRDLWLNGGLGLRTFGDAEFMSLMFKPLWAVIDACLDLSDQLGLPDDLVEKLKLQNDRIDYTIAQAELFGDQLEQLHLFHQELTAYRLPNGQKFGDWLQSQDIDP